MTKPLTEDKKHQILQLQEEAKFANEDMQSCRKFCPEDVEQYQDICSTASYKARIARLFMGVGEADQYYA